LLTSIIAPGLFFLKRKSLFSQLKDPSQTLRSTLLRKYFRRRPRAGLVPTFEEFLQFVSATIPLNMTAALKQQHRINNHWKPVYLNCAPCSQPYQIIVKIETFEQDVGYIRRRLGLAQLDNSRSSHVGQLLSALSSSRRKGGHHLSSSQSVDQVSADLSTSRHVGRLSADLNTSHHENRLGIDQLSPLSSSLHVGKLSADLSKSQLSAALSSRHVGQLSADLSKSQLSADLSSRHVVEQLSADLSSIHHHVGQKSADRPSQSAAVEAFRALDSKLVERIYQIFEPDFLLFGYSPQKYVDVAQNETNKQIE
jgi:hypothetical protein